MADTTIDSFKVAVRWDTSDFDRAAKKVEKTLRKLIALQGKVSLPSVGRTTRTLARTKTTPSAVGMAGPTSLGAETRYAKELRMQNAIADIQTRMNRNLKEGTEVSARFNKQLSNMRGGLSSAYQRNDFTKLNAELVSLRRNVNTAILAEREHERSLKKQGFAARSVAGSISNLARSYLSVFASFELIRSMTRVAKEFDRINAVMLLSSPTAKAAGENMEFVRHLAKRLGSEIMATADAFAGFNVSAMSSGMSAEESKKIFSDLATAIQATGLDAHRSGLAFLAFKQMLAGPVIQAQEMNQIVEQMPQFTGLARIALKELGYEGENFRDIIATGTVASEKFVRAVSRLAVAQAESTGAAAASQESLIAAQNRFTNAWKDVVKSVSSGGGKNSLINIFDSLTKIVENLAPAMSILVKALGAVTLVLASTVEGFTAVIGPVFSFFDVIFTGASKVLGILHGDDGLLIAFKAFGIILGGAAVIKSVTMFIGLVTALRAALVGVGMAMAFATGGASLIPGLLGVAAAGAVVGGGIYGVNRLLSGSPDKSGSVTNNNNLTIKTNNPEEVRSVVEDMLQFSYSGA